MSEDFFRTRRKENANFTIYEDENESEEHEEVDELNRTPEGETSAEEGNDLIQEEDLPTEIQEREAAIVELLENIFLDLMADDDLGPQDENLVKISMANRYGPDLAHWRTTQERLDDREYLDFLIQFQDELINGRRVILIYEQADRQNRNSADMDRLKLLLGDFFRRRQREKAKLAKKEQNKRSRKHEDDDDYGRKRGGRETSARTNIRFIR